MLHLLAIALWPLPEPAVPVADAQPPARVEAAVQETKAKKKARKGPSAADERKARRSLDEAKDARSEAQRDLRYAQAELEIAELDREVMTIEIKEDLRSAREAMELAVEAHEQFDRFERPLAMREAEMKVEDALDRIVTAQTDLQGLEEIFAEEAEARAKPEILRRARRSLERAKDRHKLAADKVVVTEKELASKGRSLLSKVRAAEAKLEAEEARATKRRRQRDLDMEKAVDAVDDKKRDARRAAARVENLQKKLNDVREARLGKGAGRKAAEKDAAKGDGDKAPAKGGDAPKKDGR